MPEVYKPSEWGARYHALQVDEALGAGSAGPGKTLVLRMDPLGQILGEHDRTFLPRDHPDYIEPGTSKGWALHMRRMNVMLDQTIVKSQLTYKQIDPSIKWDAEHSTIIFPRSGYRFQFGHCKDPGDWVRYYSNEFSHMAFDELNQFLENQYDQLTTRVRSSDHVLRRNLKIRSMSNPTLQHDGLDFAVNDPNWVRRLFVDPYMDRGLYPFCGRDNPKTGAKGVVLTRTVKLEDGSKKQLTRIYLPAWLRDNPDKEFRLDYEKRLRGKKAHIRRSLLDGDWYSTAGGYYSEAWQQNIHVCEPFSIPLDWPVFRSLDWGFKKQGCCHWAALDPEGTLYVFREWMFQGKTATEVAIRIKEFEQDEGLWDKGRSLCQGPADTQLWEQRGEQGLSKAEEMAREGVTWVPADKRSRRRNAERLVQRLEDHNDGATTPGIVFFRTCSSAIRTIPAIPTSSTDTEEPMDGGDDHAHDSICYLCAYVSRKETWQRRPDDDDEDKKPSVQRDYGRDGYGGVL